MDIDIFKSRFGSGHAKAASSLKDYIESFGYFDIKLIDFIEAAYPQLSDIIYWGHSAYYQTKKIKNQEKSAKDNTAAMELASKIFMIEDLFFKYLDQVSQPDLYISCYSVTSTLLSEYKKDRGLDIPLITYITDFSFHDFWLNEGTALYLCMANFTKKKLVEVGVEEDRIIIFGNPAPIPPKKETKNILICGGGLGMLPKDKDFYLKLSTFTDKNFIVICGKNRDLYKKIAGLEIANIDLYSYVNNMEDFYAWADLYITKPGGMSTHDAISYGLPIIYFTPFMSQEIKNKTFIDAEGIGMELKDEDLGLLDDLFSHPERIEAMRKNLKRLRQDFAPGDLIRWIKNACN